MSAREQEGRQVVIEMCSLFYRLGWMTGTGGGMSMYDGSSILVTPSGVMKERIKPRDLFAFDPETLAINYSPPGLKQSDSTPVFLAIHQLRAKTGVVIHTHSQNAVMASRLWTGDAFTITDQEMIKGVRRNGCGSAYANTDTLSIPIINNRPTESDLKGSILKALEHDLDAPCILVRNHGVYLWGSTWESAKIQAECLDYIFEIAAKIRLADSVLQSK